MARQFSLPRNYAKATVRITDYHKKEKTKNIVNTLIDKICQNLDNINLLDSIEVDNGPNDMKIFQIMVSGQKYKDVHANDN